MDDSRKQVPSEVKEREHKAWHPSTEYTRPVGDLTTHFTAVGNTMTRMSEPWPLVFTDDSTLAAQRGGIFPSLLLGEDTVAPRMQDGTDAPPPNKLKDFTMEKSRGECYVRLLTEVDPDGAKKHIVPLKPEVQEPDDTLILKLQFLLRRPVKPDDVDDFGDVETSTVVLFSFIRHNRYEAVQQLLEQDQDLVTAVDDNGNSLLHVACQNNHSRVVKLLLKLGVHMDSQNKGGNTPLHYCYAYQFVQLAEILLQSGADATIVNAAGLLPSMGIEKEGVPE